MLLSNIGKMKRLTICAAISGVILSILKRFASKFCSNSCFYDFLALKRSFDDKVTVYGLLGLEEKSLLEETFGTLSYSVSDSSFSFYN